MKVSQVTKRIGSIWVGVTLLVIIFLYSSIGSALPPVRQGALADWLGLEFLRFEKTEMQWFSWWPFQLMLALFCLSLVLATIRIRLRLINAGVWAIHTGMLVLAVSSAVYFSQKIEGDTVIFHSQALVLAPGMSEPASFVVRPDAEAVVGVEGRQYGIRVVRMNPEYVIPEGDAKGKQTTAIWLMIVPQMRGGETRGSSDPPRLGSQPFARKLVLGYPELTQDYFADGGSVVPVSEQTGGRKLLDQGLQIQLWYDPATHFYLTSTAAVYARFSPQAEWTQLRVDNVPHYFEYVDDPQVIGTTSLPPRTLDLPVHQVAQSGRQEAAYLEGVSLRVTGFLPYAMNLERLQIVPRHQRLPGAVSAGTFSQLQVQVQVGEWTGKAWLGYHDYAFPDAQRAQPGRFIFAPTTLELPDGRQMDLLYSRWREPLPAPVALDRFVLKTYPGGDQPSDYISRVRFHENREWSAVTEVRSNHPAQHGDYWYFQAQYDPQAQSHTVLGVGNRVAVGWMLAGVCLSIAGMLYAFYVKPALLSRQSRRARQADASHVCEGVPGLRPARSYARLESRGTAKVEN